MSSEEETVMQGCIGKDANLPLVTHWQRIVICLSNCCLSASVKGKAHLNLSGTKHAFFCGRMDCKRIGMVLTLDELQLY